jgi:hypothetical protein
MTISDPDFVQIWPQIAVQNIFRGEAELSSTLVADWTPAKPKAKVRTDMLKANELTRKTEIATGMDCVIDKVAGFSNL